MGRDCGGLEQPCGVVRIVQPRKLYPTKARPELFTPWTVAREIPRHVRQAEPRQVLTHETTIWRALVVPQLERELRTPARQLVRLGSAQLGRELRADACERTAHPHWHRRAITVRRVQMLDDLRRISELHPSRSVDQIRILRLAQLRELAMMHRLARRTRLD